MTTKLVVVSGSYRYPVGASLAAVLKAGGLSQMSTDARAALVLREVGPGDDCSDMPASSAAVYLGRGDIARVPLPKEQD